MAGEAGAAAGAVGAAAGAAEAGEARRGAAAAGEARRAGVAAGGEAVGIGTQASGALVLATAPQRRVEERSRARGARPSVASGGIVLSGAVGTDRLNLPFLSRVGAFTVLAEVYG